MVSKGQSEVAAAIAKAQGLNAERGDLKNILEGYSDLHSIDRGKLQETAATIAALEQAIRDEGIQLEIEPKQIPEMTVQTDESAEENAERNTAFVVPPPRTAIKSVIGPVEETVKKLERACAVDGMRAVKQLDSRALGNP